MHGMAVSANHIAGNICKKAICIASMQTVLGVPGLCHAHCWRVTSYALRRSSVSVSFALANCSACRSLDLVLRNSAAQSSLQQTGCQLVSPYCNIAALHLFTQGMNQLVTRESTRMLDHSNAACLAAMGFGCPLPGNTTIVYGYISSSLQ